ncbi:MAG: site-2 protease family protein [Deltaproteobacteria bacterium]|nr:site-2 protease family protein [Deltaproteobacteria bacterium]
MGDERDKKVHVPDEVIGPGLLPPPSDGYVYYRPRPPERRWLNYALFVTTCVTTFLAGRMQGGLLAGLQFSATLMGILLAHEMGHFLMARRHGVDASLPFFIPVPPNLSFIGTLGAVIRMRSPLTSREALLDIGAAGPIAGMLVAVPAAFVGLVLSDVRPLSEAAGGLTLGDSLLFKAFAFVIHGQIRPGYDVFLHPIAMAAWIGMLVTMLNLIPIGQLDGGHIAYAVFGRRAITVARATFLGLVVLGVAGALRLLGVSLPFGWIGWLLWALIVGLVIRLRHPPIHESNPAPLDRGRVAVAWVSLALFVATFIPSPTSTGF